MSTDKKLSYVVGSFFQPEEWPTLRGIIAYWEEDTLHIHFFFNKEASDAVKENASVMASEIIAQYTDGLLEEKYMCLPNSQDLPSSPFWVYKQPV